MSKKKKEKDKKPRWKEASPLTVGIPGEDGEYVDASLSSPTAVIGEADEDMGYRPRFKIDIFYLGTFSIKKKNLGIVSVWGSGGDTPYAEHKLYECPNEAGCKGIITPGSHAGVIAVCPMCKQAWKPEQLVGERLFVTEVERWARIISAYVRRLSFDTDIYLIRLKSTYSILEANESEVQKQLGGELLDMARQKEAAIYTRDRLLKDTMANTPLESAVRSFLLA